MTSSTSQAEPTLGKNFGKKWILTNCLAFGVGIGLPILLADLLSAERYIDYGMIAFATAWVWVGVAQWIVLRRAIPISQQWILHVAVAPILSAGLLVILLPVFPSGFFLIFLTYPVTVAFLQWHLMRQIFQPAWGWLLTNLIAVGLGSPIAIAFGIAIAMSLNLQPGIVATLSGFLYGVIYGIVTDIGLRQLVKQKNVVAGVQEKSRLDLPPDTPSWQITVFPTAVLVAIGAFWLTRLPPLPVEPVTDRAMPGLFVLFVMTASFGAVFAYIYLSVLVHELGHLLFAIARGFDVQAISISPWIMVCKGKKWQLFKTRKRYTSGFVLPIPKSLNRFSKQSLMLMMSGGLIANFVLFCVGAIPLFFVPALVSDSFPIWLIVALSGISLYMAIVNGMPLKLGYLRTDGRRLLDLAKDNLEGRKFFALYSINASLRQGIRPSELAPTLVEQVIAISDKSPEYIAGLLMAYAVALDKGEQEQAGQYLDQALALHQYFPELFRGALLLEGAYFEAHIRHRPELARQWFGKIQERALIPDYALLRAEAALLLSEGDLKGARMKAQQGMESVARDRFMKGSAIAEEDQLNNLIQSMG